MRSFKDPLKHIFSARFVFPETSVSSVFLFSLSFRVSSWSCCWRSCCSGSAPGAHWSLLLLLEKKKWWETMKSQRTRMLEHKKKKKKWFKMNFFTSPDLTVTTSVNCFSDFHLVHGKSCSLGTKFVLFWIIRCATAQKVLQNWVQYCTEKQTEN